MNVYKEEILDHFHNPRNYGQLIGAKNSATAENPSCGDKIRIDIAIKNDIVTDIKFSGEGCAISQAAASLLTEYVKGKKRTVLKKMEKTAMLQLLGLELSPTRLRCGLLALETLHKAINTNQQPITND